MHILPLFHAHMLFFQAFWFQIILTTWKTVVFLQAFTKRSHLSSVPSTNIFKGHYIEPLLIMKVQMAYKTPMNM